MKKRIRKRSDGTQACAGDHCENRFDVDYDDCRWSPILEGWFCWSCYESWTNDTSTVVHVAGPQQVTRYYVNDFEVVDESGELYPTDDFGKALVRGWVSSDGWRGRNATTITGWHEVLGGWVTGDWGDATSNRKRAFNAWAQDVCDGHIELPVPVALIFDTTSNLFSVSTSVATATEDDAETLRAYLGETLETLERSLS